MRKKIVLITTLIFIFAMLCTLFVSCDGKTAQSGKSAYELAVEQGFQGSLDEWLASLKGADGHNGIDGKDGSDGAVSIREIYEKAKTEENFQGDYFDFLQLYLNLSEDIQAASHLALLSAVRLQARGVYKSGMMSKSVTSNGSGVIYKLNKEGGDAYVITNYHVVYNSQFSSSNKISDDIDVFVYGNEQAIPAKYIGGAKDFDIAILKVSNSDVIKSSEVRAVGVASSKDVAVGSTAIAVGCPASGVNTDHNFSVTKGIDSVDSEDISASDKDSGYSIKSLRVMRVDTAINAGNSGGGLFNARGQLIGIVNAKSSSTNVDNIGYAIPSDVATGIADYAIAHCDGESNIKVKKLYLGIGVKVNSSKAVYDDTAKTVRVVEKIAVGVIKDDSILSGDLQVGDVLNAVEFDGVRYEITRSFSLADALWKVKASATQIKFYITRGTIDTSIEISVNAENLLEASYIENNEFIIC